MQFPTRVIHHYDVVIEPMWKSEREVKIGSKRGNELIMRVQSENPNIFIQRAAYDGKKNLFAPTRYFAQHTFEDVDWTDMPETDRKKRKVRVHMAHVNAIDFSILQQYIQTQQRSDRFQNEVNLMVNMLNIFVSASPRKKEGILATAKSMFVQSDRRANESIAPLELWRGYYQTVRPAFDRMVINVDVTIGVILPADKLENICAAHLRLRNIHDLRRLRPDQFQKLRHFLRMIKVNVEIETHKHKSPKVIKDVVLDVGRITFDRNGDTVTVAQHFLESHNIQIPPSTLGVRLGSIGVFPVTVCKTIQQFYKNRATPEVVRAALEFTPPNPSARAREISKAFEHFDYQNSGFLVNAGINIDQRPQMVKGRLLKGPNIVFNGSVKNLNGRPGVWDVMSQKLAKPATISKWIVINFAQVDDSSLHYFVDELIRAMRSLGITVSGPVAVEHRSVQVDIDRELDNLVQQHRPNFILAVLPDPAEEQYRKVKRFGDISRGIATQCVRWSFNLKKNVGTRRINQYQNNLILKINPKMGGTNFFAGSPVFQQMGKVPFMVIGADVSHPGPGSQMPSVASLVGSYDREACQYIASVQVQSSRVEVIENFGVMFKELLEAFQQKNNNVIPRDIYIFRDGVSEGEFVNVENYEKEALRAVVEAKYPPKHKPRVLYVVVGKRHHIRFFPGNRGGDPKGNGNFPSGLVVDDSIVHPRFCDFYLQSQPGLKGTSIPSHYTVLRNDMGMPVAAVQELAYALCHNYSRSTRSVKIPAPVYYADLVCGRAKIHYRDAINSYSASSVSSDDDMGAHLDFYRSNFDSVNSNLRQQMYYV